MFRILFLLILFSPYLAQAQSSIFSMAPVEKTYKDLDNKQIKSNIKKKFKLPHIIEEVSGLYYTPMGKFIWLNDGGGAASLYQTNGLGRLEKTIPLPNTENIDWEELTADGKGNIYIGDFGNNLNKRKDLKIYIYNLETQQIKSIPFSYPDQKAFPPDPDSQNFDMEGFFWHRGELHLFSKNKINTGNYFTKHYVLSEKAGEQVAILKDSLALMDRVVTAAAISPDKKSIALLSYDFRLRKPIPYSAASIFLIKKFTADNFFQGEIYRIKIPKFIVASQYESIDFIDNKTLYIASERTKFIRQKAKRIKLKKKHFKAKRKWHSSISSPKSTEHKTFK